MLRRVGAGLRGLAVLAVLAVCAGACTPGPEPAAPQAGETRTVDLGDGVRLELVWIPPGEFLMGSPESEEGRFDNEGPQRRVRISRGFWMGIYEVTNAQYARYKPDHASGEREGISLSEPDQPVVRVSWGDAVGFANWLSRTTAETFRLPTEAEWEYACRAGTGTRFSFGDDERRLGEYAWYDENSGGATHPVGGRKPNAWGLYDMHGNVWEWCEDDWHGSYAGAPSDGSAWVDAPQDSYRVFLRGGGWGSIPGFCRSAIRAGCTPGSRVFSLGFRVVLPAVQ